MYKEVLEIVKNNNKGIVFVLGFILGGTSVWGVFDKIQSERIKTLENSLLYSEKEVKKLEDAINLSKIEESILQGKIQELNEHTKLFKNHETLRLASLDLGGISFDKCMTLSKETFEELSFKNIEVIDGNKLYGDIDNGIISINCSRNNTNSIPVAIISKSIDISRNHGTRFLQRLLKKISPNKTDKYVFRTWDTIKNIYGEDTCLSLVEKLYQDKDIKISFKNKNAIEGRKNGVLYTFFCTLPDAYLYTASPKKLNSSDYAKNMLIPFKKLLDKWKINLIKATKAKEVDRNWSKKVSKQENCSSKHSFFYDRRQNSAYNFQNKFETGDNEVIVVSAKGKILEKSDYNNEKLTFITPQDLENFSEYIIKPYQSKVVIKTVKPYRVENKPVYYSIDKDDSNILVVYDIKYKYPDSEIIKNIHDCTFYRIITK